MLSEHDKKCERCGTTFECRADAIELCHCSVVPLSAEELKALGERFGDCLCASCIREMKAKQD